MGGNDDPNALHIEHGLNDYFNPDDPNYGFPGYQLVKVPWTADSFDDAAGYEPSQQDGVEAIDAAIKQTIADNPDGKVIAGGYSSSADVIIPEMRRLDEQGEDAPDPSQLSFLVVGNPHRPNGGIFERFPGFGLFGISFDGPNPETQ
jgi:hypothetical protein